MGLYSSLSVLKHNCHNIQAGPMTIREELCENNFVCNSSLKLKLYNMNESMNASVMSNTVWVHTQVGKCCPGFGWDKLNFLCSHWYIAVIWCQCEGSVDNTDVLVVT